MQIIVLLGMFFDAVVVFVTSQTLLFRLALAAGHTVKTLSCQNTYISNIKIYEGYLQM